MSIPPAELLALARKYRTLRSLRREKRTAAAEELRALAREFPGALRELDALPLEVLEARGEALQRAEAGAPAEPWLLWMRAYHARMRLALSVKHHLLGVRELDDANAQRIADAVSAELGLSCDASFVSRVARPPAGRLNRLVFACLAEELSCPAAELERTLFPSLTTPSGAG